VKDEPQQETNNGDSSGSGGGGGSGSGGGTLPETPSLQEENNAQAENNDGEQIKSKTVLDTESERSKDPTLDLKSVESGSEAASISISVSQAEENIEPPENASKVSIFDMESNTSETEDVNLTFGVNKSSIDRKDLNTTALYRREEGEWKELKTKYLREEESEYIFKSQITGFSPFMVAVRQSKHEITVNNTENVSENEEIQRTDSTQSFNLRILAIATITVLVVALLALRRRRTKKLSPDISKHKNQADKLKNGEGTQ
jgi:PGF-pre-PGF domain-containing protein